MTDNRASDLDPQEPNNIAEPEAVLRGRVSLPGWEKAYVALSGLVGGRSS